MLLGRAVREALAAKQRAAAKWDIEGTKHKSTTYNPQLIMCFCG